MDDDDPTDDSASTSLLAPPPRPAHLRVARSLADAAPGEMVFVNRRGQSLTARQVAAANAGFWALVAGSGVFVGLMYGVQDRDRPAVRVPVGRGPRRVAGADAAGSARRPAPDRAGAARRARIPA